jgi:hypothetical protein
MMTGVSDCKKMPMKSGQLNIINLPRRYEFDDLKFDTDQ